MSSSKSIGCVVGKADVRGGPVAPVRPRPHRRLRRNGEVLRSAKNRPTAFVSVNALASASIGIRRVAGKISWTMCGPSGESTGLRGSRGAFIGSNRCPCSQRTILVPAAVSKRRSTESAHRAPSRSANTAAETPSHATAASWLPTTTTTSRPGARSNSRSAAVSAGWASRGAVDRSARLGPQLDHVTVEHHHTGAGPARQPFHQVALRPARGSRRSLP
jgi:hypothetical protein